ncbi:MAG: putative lipid II flippase FtsW [Alphaproteobacteria bacterium MarineAlpha5_Bin9]|nr:MAG: putative lipid II flippase FtsW [Alphaproteobacteria bacterium MarineAlpha5_Bin9]|tara:strand:- start:7943 stop:9013 length:1071 start_codon:yes stop_codon:yes gene_type:complete
MNKIFQNWLKNIDLFSFLSFMILIIIGIILSFSTQDNLAFIQRHLFYSFFSVILIIILSFLDVKRIRRVSLIGLVICILIMILILFNDFEINGAKRWLKFFGGFTIQPSEFVKPFFFVISGWFLTKGIEGKNESLYFVFLSFLTLITLLILQPDFGMTVLISVTFFCQLFMAGLSIYLVAVVFILMILLFFLSYIFLGHVNLRIKSWIEHFINPDPYSQISKSLNSFMSGGFLGKGPGQGNLKNQLPEANTDFIFAVAGEEFGFIFCSIIVSVFLIIIIRNLLKLLKIEKPYIIISIVGLICSFGIQTLINIFSSLSLIPAKGMTLPLISYGGSSMLSTGILIGFLLSFTNKKNYD